ncbi:histidine--tRNA ligase [candidate division WOR-1 bacterium RIFCSPHIGHO2_02_FULL_53_26]|nr:MAG: histidine--tRNA ligase [candidate division WOR-1 bacterium RIFCSPHIGHO2_02_FULL_53_26]
MKYAVPRGTKDILPDDTPLWQFIEDTCRETFGLFNYREIRTPIFEATDVFTRSIGYTTDIVKKEMYTFPDRKGRSLTLRPEATASVVRAGLENNLITPDNLLKVYYLGPMFRYERPQAGRQRQFHQAGVEAFGSADPALDAEMIQLSVKLFERLGLKELEVDINSVGCKKCQPAYREALKKYFESNLANLCGDCRQRFELNPLRILDCKEAHCRKYIEQAPAMVDHLDAECKAHFSQVVGWLDHLLVKYKINDRLVRGLDYYTRTAFEIVAKQLGAQNAVCGGGRYDDLVEEMGGKSVPAIGFAAGLERVVEILKAESRQSKIENRIGLFIATIGDEARQVGFHLLTKAREKGISADIDFQGKSLKAQMKAADRLGARYVYIIGDDELKNKSAVLKNMGTAEQKEVSFGELLSVFVK